MQINEFTTRKLGEVLAFSRVGSETWEKGRKGMETAFGSNGNVQAIIDDLKSHAEQIESIADEAAVREALEAKAESTGRKLRSMRDLYIGDEWDNPAELLEWSGFFEGAAIVHWNLVVGAAEIVKDAMLNDLALVGVHLHHELLDTVETQIKEIGKQKAVG